MSAESQSKLVDQISDAVFERISKKLDESVSPQLAQIETLIGVVKVMLQQQPATRSVRASGKSTAAKANAGGERVVYANSRIYFGSRARDSESFYDEIKANYPDLFEAALAKATADDDEKAAKGKARRKEDDFRKAVALEVFAKLEDGQKEKIKNEWKAWCRGEEIGQPAAAPLQADSEVAAE